MSSEKRHVQRYDEACAALDALDTEMVGEALYAIDTYVGWLRNQIGAKRLTIQALKVEIAELKEPPTKAWKTDETDLAIQRWAEKHLDINPFTEGE